MLVIIHLVCLTPLAAPQPIIFLFQIAVQNLLQLMGRFLCPTLKSYACPDYLVSYRTQYILCIYPVILNHLVYFSMSKIAFAID